MTRFPGATNCYSEEISPAALPIDGPVVDLLGRHSTLLATLKVCPQIACPGIGFQLFSRSFSLTVIPTLATAQSMNAMEGPALIVFGSYSCPMWREKAPMIKDMAVQFR